MMRKLAIALSLVSAMGTGAANALGLGEAKVNSSLNQPLSAEIELVNIRGLQQNEILPALASREEFAKASVDRVYFLSDLRFEVSHNDKGRTVIRLTSSKPVKEPYLNFLVEVIWPSGRLLREYALLIDPPLFSNDTTSGQLVMSSTSGLPPIEVMNEEDALLQEQTGVRSAKVAKQVPSSSKPVSSTSASGGGSYGPTSRTDTLWGIALKVRPDRSVSPQQVMLALQDLNPDAFVNGNINILKSGQILRVPSAEDISARSRGQAVNQVTQQNQAFEEGRPVSSRIVDSTLRPQPEARSSAQQAPAGSELKIVVAKSDQPDAAKTGAHAGTSNVGGGASVGEQDLVVTLEKLDKARVENDELNSRVRDLEDQLQTLQRLLSLKDDELADMQHQFGKVDEQTAQKDSMTQTTTPAEAVPAQSESSGDSMQGSTGDSQGNQAEPSNVATQDVQTPAEPETNAPGETNKNVEAPVEPVPPLARDVKPTMAPQLEQTPVDEHAAVQESLVDEIIKNPLYLGGGIIGALVLIFGLIGLSRHNARKERDFHESLAVEAGSDEDIDLDFDSSELDEAGDEDHSPARKPEAEDPLAEADVYIAYGRLDQAAHVLENGVSEEPGRSDLRVKLLEVYKQLGDTQAFQKQFNEIDALGDEEALAQAESLRSDFAELSEPEISIDDLENELLSGSTSKTVQYKAPGKAVDKLIEEEEIAPVKAARVSVEPELDFELDEEDLALDSSRNELGEDDLGVDLDTDELEPASLDLDSLEDQADNAIELDDEALELDEADLSLEEVDVLEDDGYVPSELDEVTPENELSSLDLDSEEESLDLQSMKEELEEVSSVLADTESALDDLDEMDDIDDLDLDADLSLEDLDAELDAEMDSVDETIEHEEESVESDELDIESDFDEEDDNDLSATIIAPPRKTQDQALNAEEELIDEVDLESELSLDELDSAELEEVALDSDLTLEDEEGRSLDADLDLSDIGSDDELEELEISEVLEDGYSLDTDEELESLGLSEETESLLEEDVSGGAADDDFDYLSGTDEAATKLDLARAYIDMGDQEGARDILEEVAIEGNEEQKTEAKRLMKDLD